MNAKLILSFALSIASVSFIGAGSIQGQESEVKQIQLRLFVPEGAKVFCITKESLNGKPEEKLEYAVKNGEVLWEFSPEILSDTWGPASVIAQVDLPDSKSIRKKVFLCKGDSRDPQTVTFKYSASDRKALTFEYWCQVKAIQEGWKVDVEDTVERAEYFTSRAARDIDDLDVAGVDGKVVEVVQEFNVYLKRGARALERHTTDGKFQVFKESIFRGLTGDPFGTYRDLESERDGVKTSGEEITDKIESVRKQMIAEYGMEFPEIPDYL